MAYISFARFPYVVEGGMGVSIDKMCHHRCSRSTLFACLSWYRCQTRSPRALQLKWHERAFYPTLMTGEVEVRISGSLSRDQHMNIVGSFLTRGGLIPSSKKAAASSILLRATVRRRRIVRAVMALTTFKFVAYETGPTPPTPTSACDVQPLGRIP